MSDAGQAFNPALVRRYPEVAVSGFTHDDVEIAFSAQVRSLIKPTFHVLDYGAGRGEWFEDDDNAFRRNLQLLKGQCLEIIGCDVDPAVEANRAVDRTVVIDPGKPLPFDHSQFDLIVSRYVFEHVADPAEVASELLRVLKPGGWICALTPNKWGYPAIGARLIPNRYHASAISSVQPGGRDAHDVFPTRYRLNTRSSLRQHFGSSADVYIQYVSGPPSYYFGNAPLFRAFSLLHALLPQRLSTALMIFIRKRQV